MSLSEFYFAHPGVFLIPVEEMSPAGMSGAFARELQQQRGVSAEWVTLFNDAVSTYFMRVRSLAKQAPSFWRSPRLANICIVQDVERTRPYFQPFSQSSWLLYESDFDPARSNLEHAVYQLVHVERLGLTGDAAMTWMHGLSYFMERTDAEHEAFAAGCQMSTRPDVDAFRALAEHLGVVRELYHDSLRPCPDAATSGMARIGAVGLLVPQEQKAVLQVLSKKCLAASHDVVRGHYERQHVTTREIEVPDEHPDTADELVDWLRQAKPMVLLTDHLGGVVWDPDASDNTDAARAVLDGVPARVAESLKQDWLLIDAHSRAFLDAVVDADELHPPGESLDQEDGVYIHAQRKIVAYSFVQPGLKTLAEEAPPFHRLLVGARTIHEWGHLAVDAGTVRVPQERDEEHTQARRQLVSLFNEIVANAPDTLRDTAEREVELLAREGYRLGEMPLQRVGDYLANLLAREFLSTAEMESYIRGNVRPLIDATDVGPYLRLARHAYEYQYLLLSSVADPFGYFLSSTWFADQFFETGIVDETRTRELFDAVTALFSCYAIDETRICLPR